MWIFDLHSGAWSELNTWFKLQDWESAINFKKDYTQSDFILTFPLVTEAVCRKNVGKVTVFSFSFQERFLELLGFRIEF